MGTAASEIEQFCNLIAGRLRPLGAVAHIYLSKESVMLGWVLTFLVIAIVAGVLGFGGVATASAGIAQTIFYIFLVLVLVSLVYRLLKGRGSI